MTFFKNLKSAAQKTSGQQTTSKQYIEESKDQIESSSEVSPSIQQPQNSTIDEIILEKTKKFEEKLKNCEDEINDLHRQIGFNVEMEIEFTELLEKIKVQRTRIDEINTQILNLENNYLCPSCKKEFPTDSRFCPFCGTKLKQEESGADHGNQSEISTQ